MAGVQENYIESSNIQSIEKDLNQIPNEETPKIDFSNTLTMIKAMKNTSVEVYFNTLVSGKFDFDGLKKHERKDIQEHLTIYIQDKQNKENILHNYIKYENSIPTRIKEIIEDTYSHEEIGEYELKLYFATQDIISLGKEINGEDWDGSSIEQDNPNIYKICTGNFFSEEQFISKFNELNDTRKQGNINIMGKVNFESFDIGKLDIHKIKNKLYIGDEPLTDALLSNEQILNYIKNYDNFNYANDEEFKNDLQYLSTREIDRFESKLKNHELKDEDENYNLHESGLNFYKEYELANKKDILNAFEKGDYYKLEKKHHKLGEIMELLEIQEDDIPDLKEEKARLIYLLNHGMFRIFQVEVGAIDTNLSIFKSSAILGDDTLKALDDHLNQYRKEKSPEFFKLLEDIKNIKVDIDGALGDPEIKKELNTDEKIANVTYVTDMFKSLFIQRLKNGTCTIKNIETFKHQIAYVLATLHHECRYSNTATNGTYRGFGQIHKSYTHFWTSFIQGSGLEFENRNSNNINFKGNPKGFLDREISRFTFVYGLTYGLFSSGGNLDKYINDEKTDYVGARQIEAGAFAKTVADTAKIWENFVK